LQNKILVQGGWFAGFNASLIRTAFSQTVSTNLRYQLAFLTL